MERTLGRKRNTMMKTKSNTVRKLTWYERLTFTVAWPFVVVCMGFMFFLVFCMMLLMWPMIPFISEIKSDTKDE